MVYTTKKTFICFTIHSRLDDGLLTQDLAGSPASGSGMGLYVR